MYSQERIGLDIADQLAEVRQPHILAVKLYEKETGIKINPKTAYAQKGKWIEVAGELFREKSLH